MSQNIQPYQGLPPDPAPRYEIVDTIATGDFATVYRARDRELGREVAIKAIHQQFLGDPRQLERYWREAQLLATLQHPNILTIYDIVRPRGWLVLELMRGSLARAIESGPMDLDFLRVSLVCCLNALHFLHSNGVIHGDVKPSNLLVDARGMVKLGDFGLARRASNEQGSLLKGTTKYMAPELVSNQFGPIGPASDLYSLGFSCYELMCGPQFDSLFPGLGTFGRDRQIAWLMWHAAADRQLPPVTRVLEGVPPDLAHVIDRLTTKDQSRRYQSAAEAIQDLRVTQTHPAGAAPAEPAAPPVDKKKRVKRIALFAGIAVLWLVVGLFMLFDRTSTPPPERKLAVQGRILKVDPDDRKLVVESSADGVRVTVAFKPGDKFFLNHKGGRLVDLKESDEVIVEDAANDQGKPIKIVSALRPEGLQGQVKAVQADARLLVVAYAGSGAQGAQEMAVQVPEKLKITFNGKQAIQGRPVALGDLKPADRVEVRYSVEEKTRTALSVRAQREVEVEGTIRGVDAAQAELTLALGAGSDGELVKLAFAADCQIELNGSKALNEKALAPGDLQPGDKVKVVHDEQVRRIEAYRVFGQAGVIQALRPGALDVLEQGKDRPAVFTVGPGCKITLGGEPVTLADLRAGDEVDIRHDTAGGPSAKAKEIAARRPANKTRWAVIAGVGDYNDKDVGRLEQVPDDVRTLQETLVKRYAVPARQALLLLDPPQARLRDALAGVFQQATPESEVVVYFGGHALVDKDGKVYLAPKDFRRDDMASTGVALQWIVDQFEACKAKQKLLLLDACQAGRSVDREKEPSTAEMFDSLQGPAGQAALRTVTGMASCSPGERGQVVAEKNRGQFALALCDGYSGRADKNRDNLIEPSELFASVTESMASTAGPSPQTAKLFLPDNRPARLSAEAKKAIRALAALVNSGDGGMNEAKTLYAEAQNQAGEEVEPKLVYGLIMLKSKAAKQRADAGRFFDKLKTEKPELLLPLEVSAWLLFEKRAYQAGVGELTELVAKTPKPKKPKQPYPADAQQIFQWVGQLREFAATIDEPRAVPEPSLKKLDAAVAEHGPEMAGFYEKGREQTRAVSREFDAKTASATDDAMKAKLKIDRRQVGNYVLFPFDVAIGSVLAGMER